MEYGPLLERMRAYAKSEDLDVTWDEVKSAFDEDLSVLSDYHTRRIAVNFETWITRERQNSERGVDGA